MITNRLYYQDAYTTRFSGRIVERVQEKGKTAVVLDQTYFYPSSGGQPFDMGKINESIVVDVTIRELDGAILHWIDQGDFWSDKVAAEVEWNRRFDHMQQHTGQHILSQAFIQIAEAETVGFHLSDNSVTIDLQCDTMQPDHIDHAEYLANQIVWQNRPVSIQVVSIEEARELNVRKIPQSHDGNLRLIEIEDFDLTACGGTHVNRTGEVGIIKITKLERFADKLRVEFCCGQRALRDYQQKNSIVTQLTRQLTTGVPELTSSVTKIQNELKESRRTLKQQRNAILRIEADNLLQMARAQRKKKIDPMIITRVYPENESDPGQLRALASRVIKEEGVVALLGLAGKKSLLIFSRSPDAPGQMNQLLKAALGTLGSASGGGSELMAQGGGPQADVERVELAIARAERLLIGQL